MRHLHEPEYHDAGDVLHRIAIEVQRCEVILRGIETAVGPMIAAHYTDGCSHALQDVDLLGQSLADIAICLSGLAVRAGGDLQVDVSHLLSPLRLDALYQRLGGKDVVELRPEERVALF